MSALALVSIVQLSLLAALPDDLAQAYARSIRSGRPLVILVGAEWCPGCQTMKRKVLPLVARAGGLKEVEYAYVDVDRQPGLAKRLLRGEGIPQLIRIHKTPKGWRGEYLLGAADAEAVTRFVKGEPKPDPEPVASRLRAAAPR